MKTSGSEVVRYRDRPVLMRKNAGNDSLSEDVPGGWNLRRRYRALRRVAPRRETIDGALDGLRLRIDSFPYRQYQPMPVVGLAAATRASGTVSRFEAMVPVLETTGAKDAVDLGSNAGWYVLQLGERGVATVGVEDNPVNYRTALVAVRRSGLANVGVLVMTITPETVSLLPTVDAILMLSIWHHFVRGYDLETATDMLRTTWTRTRRVLFFDTGEDEMGADFGLPAFQPDARSWLEDYLAETCQGGEVQHLGLHDAFGPDGRACHRNLFAVVRPELRARVVARW